MNLNDITQIISTVGFPIVACGALFYEMNVQSKRHAEEMDKMTEALNNNTLAITELRDNIKKD